MPLLPLQRPPSGRRHPYQAPLSPLGTLSAPSFFLSFLSRLSLFSLQQMPHTMPSPEIADSRASRPLPHPTISPPQPGLPYPAHTPEAAPLPDHLIVTPSPPMPPLSCPRSPSRLHAPAAPFSAHIGGCWFVTWTRNPSSFVMPKRMDQSVRTAIYVVCNPSASLFLSLPSYKLRSQGNQLDM
ncbi:uncharacterized protein J3D65DRAFT_245925 [Phyllosticta citribraziliensis]|uniref:Uncharacterized protein n=1 Tax=Phyllosticta citribraziliensis TaxID=989973 RepID=A0ABR1LZQ8_9PEZI